MPLTVVTGVANAGKTGVIHARIRAHVASGDRALLLLPSPADVARAMAELADDCPAGVEITTLGSHLDECWRSIGDGRRLVTAVQRAVILEESGNQVDLGCLTDSAGMPGFRRMLASLVQRAAESELTVGQEPAPDDAPAACLLRVLIAYSSALRSAGLIERGEAYRSVAARAGALHLPDMIALNRFTGLTGPQERYVIAAARGHDVCLTLTHSESLPATEAASALVTRLSSHGQVIEVGSDSVYSPDAELLTIERDFGTRLERPLRSTGAVVVSEARGRASEAARMVAEIQDAIACGIDAGGIAVVIRDPAAHLRALRFALDEAGIPAHWDVQVPFERTGLGRVVLGLLAVCAGAADRAMWMDLMRSPYCPASADSLDDMDLRIRRQGVRGSAAARRLDSWLEGEPAAFMRAAKEAYRGITDEAAESAWYALTMAMIGRAHPHGVVLTPEAMLDAAAARALVEAIAGLRGASSAASPAQILGSALRGAPITVSSSPDGASVQVMSAERIRGRRYRCVIVGGLTEGEFPRPTRDLGVGALGADAVLASAGIDTSPRDDINAERLLFYQVITRARERLVLSRRSHDDHGQPLQPSVFLEEVLDLYGRDEDDGGDRLSTPPVRTLGLDVGRPDAGAPRTPRRAARAVACEGGGGVSARREPGRGVSLRAEESHSETGRQALSGEARRALQARGVFSVSDIETYLQCPYRWFIERVIKPYDLDSKVDASSSGQAAHQVLARVYDRFVVETGLRRVTPDTLERALGLLPDVVSEALGDIHPETARESADVRRALHSTAGMLAVDSNLLPGFEPLYREWSFGMDDSDPPELLDGYALRGRIDRIDCSASHLVITDYKLGGVGPERGVARFVEGGLVQLPLYAHVAARRLGLEIAGAVYRSITRGQLRGFVSEGLKGKPFVSTDVVDSAGVEQVISAARERAAEAVRGMRAGEIDAVPAGGVCSPYCAAQYFCPGRGRHHA